jgi:hypothetical protein
MTPKKRRPPRLGAAEIDALPVAHLTVAEVKQVAREGGVAAALAEALKIDVRRLRFWALLDRWEAEDPSTPDDIAKGEALWRRMQWSWMRARSERLPGATKRSGTRSNTT